LVEQYVEGRPRRAALDAFPAPPHRRRPGVRRGRTARAPRAARVTCGGTAHRPRHRPAYTLPPRPRAAAVPAGPPRLGRAAGGRISP